MNRFIINGANCREYVKDCLDSVKLYKDFTAIVVDDGSTDDTTQEIYSNLDSRFELVVKANNEGPAAARWTAFQHLEANPSDRIILLDLDDKLVHHAVNFEADVTYGSTITKSGKMLTGAYPDEVVKKKSFRETSWKCFPLRTFTYETFLKCGFTADDFKYSEDVVIKGKQWKKGDWFKVCTDVALMHPLLENAATIQHIPYVLYHYNDIGNHTGRAKYPIELWAETNKQINESNRIKNR